MSVELIRVAGLCDAPYAYASVASPDSLVYAAGACPLDKDGATVGVGDIRLQAQQCILNLREALTASGSSITDVLKTTIYVASSARTDLVAAWEEISAAFGEHDAPSTLLGVAVLGYPDQLVELEAVAVRRS
ncbi:RidA family protein [Actinoallomurus soli]|uniref:RidA family protein n=1 Tax=Actinoallomurus soli TaxID=2952535 RepID=UPI0020927E9D|nr:RidA family protein [Actinoallomurus soli]MCO5974648.1 RidA family protein [Actinoallomurus soli]